MDLLGRVVVSLAILVFRSRWFPRFRVWLIIAGVAYGPELAGLCSAVPGPGVPHRPARAARGTRVRALAPGHGCERRRNRGRRRRVTHSPGSVDQGATPPGRSGNLEPRTWRLGGNWFSRHRSGPDRALPRRLWSTQSTAPGASSGTQLHSTHSSVRPEFLYAPQRREQRCSRGRHHRRAAPFSKRRLPDRTQVRDPVRPGVSLWIGIDDFIAHASGLDGMNSIRSSRPIAGCQST